MTNRLLIVHHTPSPHTHEMFEPVVSGATEPEIEGVEGYESLESRSRLAD